MSEAGRISISAKQRKAVGLEEGELAIARVDNGEIRIRPVRTVLAGLRATVREHVANSGESADRFLADRREDASREERQCPESLIMRGPAGAVDRNAVSGSGNGDLQSARIRTAGPAMLWPRSFRHSRNGAPGLRAARSADPWRYVRRPASGTQAAVQVRLPNAQCSWVPALERRQPPAVTAARPVVHRPRPKPPHVSRRQPPRASSVANQLIPTRLKNHPFASPDRCDPVWV